MKNKSWNIQPGYACKFSATFFNFCFFSDKVPPGKSIARATRLTETVRDFGSSFRKEHHSPAGGWGVSPPVTKGLTDAPRREYDYVKGHRSR